MNRLIFACLFVLLCPLNIFAATDFKPIEAGFLNPPEDTRPGMYWYFISQHMSKEGITKDLENMAEVGIGETYIGIIQEDGMPMGDVEALSPEWWDCIRHAVKEGTRLGISISFFNSPGWSQSGGPWVPEEDAMRYLDYSETLIKGPGRREVALPKPKNFFQDIAVIAYPYDRESFPPVSTVLVYPSVDDMKNLFDWDLSTVAKFGNKANEPVAIEYIFEELYTARSLTIHPGDRNVAVRVEVQVKYGNEFVKVKEHSFDRRNNDWGHTLGPLHYGPMVMALDDITCKEMRIVIHGAYEGFEVKEIELSARNKLEDYVEKWLNKMPFGHVIEWDTYRWKTQQQLNDYGVVKPETVLDITEFFDGEKLVWNAPKGNWKVMRLGMSLIGTKNSPAPASAKGYEVDKMNKRVLQHHFDSYMGKILEGLSPEEKKTVKHMIADSYEVGPQNWTDGMRDDFIATFGYDPIPWLPVLNGTIVGSAEQSDRFLWDIRRNIADRIAYEYVGGLREIAEKNDLILWLENYGHWGFPTEFLTYGGQSHEIGGEFFTNWNFKVECRLAASASHIYGKNKVYAESYTSDRQDFLASPFKLKKIGDWSLTEGVNAAIFHLCIHQPYDDKFPGINAWFGTEFHRHNTWYPKSKSWVDYQRRSYFMLRQGRHVADVCFFIGEDSPNMGGWIDESLSKGYNYDYINAEVILKYMTVENGRMVLPGGASYAVMVLPPYETMRPELLNKIAELVEQGAVILGPPPSKSPSLTNFPECDGQVRELALKLWGTYTVSEKDVLNRKIGEGRVCYNIPLNQLLHESSVEEDLIIRNNPGVLWVHRALDDSDIYFLSNQTEETVSFISSFRVRNKQPELWDAITGEFRSLPDFSNKDGRTDVYLKMEPLQSYFIVFRQDSDQPQTSLVLDRNFPPKQLLAKVNGPWNVRFLNKLLDTDFTVRFDQLQDWIYNTDERVKYFSGDATYTNTFELKTKDLKYKIYLSLEEINEIAEVKINGKVIATLWAKPYVVDITDAVKKGSNKVEITVTNLWKNQLIKEAMLPEGERKTWLSKPGQVRKTDPLQPSGLKGEVSILYMDQK